MATYESMSVVTSSVTATHEASANPVLSLRCTTPGTSADYSKYITDNAKKTDRVNQPDMLEFSLAPVDTDFVKLHRGDYIVFDTVTYPRWFTGYITTEPEMSYLGVDSTGAQKWLYKYTAVSDEYIMNLKPLPMGLQFVNTTQGTILRSLIDRIQPGVFDTTQVQDGLTVAQYLVDSTKVFSDIVKDFADQANYRFYAKNHTIYFAPLDSFPVAVTVDSTQTDDFTPSQLNIQGGRDQVTNDCVVAGGVEPQDYINELFLGDGFTGQFSLISGVFGTAGLDLLDEVWSGSSIDTNKWSIYDTVNNWLRVQSGYLNVLGGNNDGQFSTYLQAANVLPLEGNVRFTHGEYDFIKYSDGVICALYTNIVTPPVLDSITGNQVFSNCLYGIRVSKSGDGFSTLLNPIVNGNVDTTQVMPIYNYSYRYVIRTVMSFEKMHRLGQQYSYRDGAGVVGTYGSDNQSDVVSFQTWITAIDPNTGNTMSTTTWQNSEISVPASMNYGLYTPVVSNDMYCTMTGITVSVPIQASLEVKSITNPTWTIKGGGDIWGNNDFFHYVYKAVSGDFTVIARLASLENQANGNTKAGLMIRDSLSAQSVHFSFLVTAGNGGYTRYRTSIGNATQQGPTITQDQAGQPQFLQAPEWLMIERKGNSFTASYSVDGSSWTPTTAVSVPLGYSVTAGVAVCADNINSKYLVEGVFDSISFSPNPSGNFYNTDVGNGAVVGGNAISTTDWESRLIGPNEMDTLDGLAPVATIVESASSSGSSSNNSSLGSFVYNPGQATLTFFKDASTKTTTIPNQGDLLHLAYRRAGPAMARIIQPDSIAAESAAWGDSGHRASFKTNITPAPRNAAECEAAAAAEIGDSDYRHFDGDYTVFSTQVMGEPVAGTNIMFSNMPDELASLQSEVIQSVETTLVATELFEHKITFGKPDLMTRFTAQFDAVKGVNLPQEAVDIPKTLHIDYVGQAYAPDVTAPIFNGLDRNTFFIDCGQPARSGGFEIRYTNEGWGCDDGKNLIARIIGQQTFSVPRNDRGRIFFIREFDLRNKCLWSEDLTQTAWAKSNGVTLTTISTQDADDNRSRISSVGFQTTGQSVSQDINIQVIAGTKLAGSATLKGTEGQAVRVQLVQSNNHAIVFASQQVTLSGGWQRVTVGATLATTVLSAFVTLLVTNVTPAMNVYITRGSVEQNTLEETCYFKTVSQPYGAVSRYSAGLHIGLPGVPPAPNGAVDFSNITQPVITVQLPSFAVDVWGYEIRSSDNQTVLQKQALTDAGYVTTFTANNTVRNLSYYLYTYNLLGEYSDPYNLIARIPLPSVTNVYVDDNLKQLNWTGVNAERYIVQVDPGNPNFYAPSAMQTTPFSYLSIGDGDFFPRRYFAVTPYDAIGPGVPVTISHEYHPAPVLQFDGNEVHNIPAPADPATPPVAPAAVKKFVNQFVQSSWNNYKINEGRYNPKLIDD